jgi:transcriptional regulator with XRE-family HTH domain
MSMNKKWFERRWRDLGMTQNEVARRMGMSNPALSRMFSEMRRMRLDEAVMIALILRVEVLDVIRESGVMNGAPARKVGVSAENYLSPTDAKQLDSINSSKPFTSKVLGLRPN